MLNKPMMSYSQNKSKELNDFIQNHMSDYFTVGLDPDGNRMYRVKMDLKQRTPMRERYDRYVGLLGSIYDVIQIVKQMWTQYSQYRSEQDAEEGVDEEEGGEEDQQEPQLD